MLFYSNMCTNGCQSCYLSQAVSHRRNVGQAPAEVSASEGHFVFKAFRLPEEQYAAFRPGSDAKPQPRNLKAADAPLDFGCFRVLGSLEWGC